MKDTMRKNKGECVREMKERVDQVEDGNEMLRRKKRRKKVHMSEEKAKGQKFE